MKITDFIPADLILPKLKADQKVDLITEFSETISEFETTLDKDLVAHVLLEREKLGSTGIQDGVAIPHGKIASLDRVLLAIGCSKAGIDFQAHDNKPSHLFFVLLAPEEETGLHIKILAKLSRLLKRASLREALIASETKEEIAAHLMEAESKFEQ